MREMSEKYRRKLESEREAAVLVRHAMRLDTEAFMAVLIESAGPEVAAPENARIEQLLMGALFFARRAVADAAGGYGVPDEQVIDGQVRYLTAVLEGVYEPPPEAY